MHPLEKLVQRHKAGEQIGFTQFVLPILLSLKLRWSKR